MPSAGNTRARACSTSAAEKRGSGTGMDALAIRHLSARRDRHKSKKARRRPLSLSEEPGLLQSATEKRPPPSWSAWGRAARFFRGCFHTQSAQRTGCPNLAARVPHKMQISKVKNRSQVPQERVLGPGRRGAGKKWPRPRQEEVQFLLHGFGYGPWHSCLVGTIQRVRLLTREQSRPAAKGDLGLLQCE